ncbi:hypothetical protein C8Q72DRAFT_830589, partial [Fomitopsis betulina]
MDWTPQSTPHTSPRFLRPLLSQSSHAPARAYRNPPSRRLGQTSSQPPMDETIKQATNTLTLDLDIDNDGYLPRAFDPLSAVFDPDQVVDGFPRTRCPELPSSSEFPLFLLDATSDYQAPGSTLVSNYEADDPLSWLDLEALIQATYSDDAQTYSDASWLTDMLLGNDSPSSASLSNPDQISHEDAGSFPEPTGMLNDFVKDLQAALLEPANPTHLASEYHDITRPDDQSVREPHIDLDWWRDWVNEDYAPATPFPGFEPSGSSAALYEVESTHYPSSHDFTFATVYTPRQLPAGSAWNWRPRGIQRRVSWNSTGVQLIPREM